MKSSFLLYILSLVLSALACGISALPENNVVDGIPTSQEVEITNTHSAPKMSMIVTAETLRIRDGAGEEFEEVGLLQNGQIVTCSSIDQAEDGGLWCRHELGWSNIRYMKGLK